MKDTPTAPDIAAFDSMPAMHDAAHVAAKHVVQLAVQNPGSLQRIVENDLAMLIFERATREVAWPGVRQALIIRGHREADVDYVVMAVRKFKQDADRMKAAMGKRGRQ